MATPTNEELDAALRENAAGPAKVTVDGQTVEQHSIADQIELDRYVNSKAAMVRVNRGLRLSVFGQPGAGG